MGHARVIPPAFLPLLLSGAGVERVRQTLPYKDPAPLDRLAEGLRKAGLAE